jgi:hypothetical protein
MDDRLQKALSFSNYQFALTNQRKILREKLDSSLLYGYNGGIFKVDDSLISFINFLSDQGRANIPILDSNKNPILIENLKTFLDEILNVYFSAVLDYYNEYEKIKKNRTTEKLIDL